MVEYTCKIFKITVEIRLVRREYSGGKDKENIFAKSYLE